LDNQNIPNENTLMLLPKMSLLQSKISPENYKSDYETMQIQPIPKLEEDLKANQ
jgi:hypothetical protein